MDEFNSDDYYIYCSGQESLKRWEYQTILPDSWKTYIQVKKKQLEVNMEQWTGSKLGKGYDKAVYCHPAYLTYMQSTTCRGWAVWITSWNQDCQKKYQQPQICSSILMTESRAGLKSLLMKMKKECEKAGLKLNIQKIKIMASGPISSWQTEG